MASHRIGARVSRLSPAQLCAIIEAQAGASDAALRVAEEHAARLVEQPESVLSVLLSPDLAPHILARLPAKEHAAKATCRAWYRGWKARRERPRLLVVGGGNSSLRGSKFFSSLERYDPAANAWEGGVLTPMPTPIPRRFVGKAMFDGKLYVVGGRAPCRPSSSSVERYEPAAKSWEAVAPMTSARAGLGVAVLDGKLYAVGGCNNNRNPRARSYDHLSSVERYDPATNAWEVVAPMAVERLDPAVTVIDGKLYAAGGQGLAGRLSSVERYDPAANAWEEVAPMTLARMEHAMAVLDSKLYAMGGYGNDDGRLSSVERYDPALNAWEAVAPMVKARSGCGVAALDGKLYAVGGSSPAGDLSSVERYDPATNAWEEVASMAKARHSPCLALL